MMSEECRAFLKRLGESNHTMGVFRSELGRISEELFGERLRIADFMARYRWELETGRLRVRDRDLCTDRRCVSVDRLIHTMAKYYEWTGERTKAVRRVETYCGE